MATQIQRHVSDMTIKCLMSFDETDIRILDYAVRERIVEEATKQLVTQFIEKKGEEILAAIDPKVVMNLIVTEVSKRILNTVLKP